MLVLLSLWLLLLLLLSSSWSMHLYKNEFVLSFCVLLSNYSLAFTDWWLFMINLHMVQSEKDCYVQFSPFCFLVCEGVYERMRIRESEILGRQQHLGLVILHHLFFFFFFLFALLHTYWETQLAVQIFGISFQLLGQETMDERRRRWIIPVCLHKSILKSGTISLVYSTLIRVDSIIHYTTVAEYWKWDCTIFSDPLYCSFN